MLKALPAGTLVLAGCTVALEDTGGGEPAGGATAPTILDADAWCYTKGGDPAEWVADLYADDPQGADTLQSFFSNGVTVLSAGETVATYELACVSNGHCSSNWSESEDGILCENASSWIIRLRVVDVDGNWSDPVDRVGRQGTNATGR